MSALHTLSSGENGGAALSSGTTQEVSFADWSERHAPYAFNTLDERSTNSFPITALQIISLQLHFSNFKAFQIMFTHVYLIH